MWSWVVFLPGSQIIHVLLSHARNITKLNISVCQCRCFLFSDDDDKVGSDDDNDDFGGGGVDDEMFPGDADVPETIEPMGMKNTT